MVLTYLEQFESPWDIISSNLLGHSYEAVKDQFQHYSLIFYSKKIVTAIHSSTLFPILQWEILGGSNICYI